MLNTRHQSDAGLLRTDAPGRLFSLGGRGDKNAQRAGGCEFAKQPTAGCDRFPIMGEKGAERPGEEKPAAG